MLLETGLSLPPGIRVAMSTRQGGVSEGPWASLNLALHVGDSPASVRVNRERLSLAAGFPTEPCWLNQVHGNRVALEGDADAAFTSEQNTVLCVQVADCVPLLVWSMDGREIAAIHAGWRGLENGVIAAALKHFQGKRLGAWVGPHIRQCHYEVGREVFDQFIQTDPTCAEAFIPAGPGHWRLAMSWIARRQLVACGVSEIIESDICTSCDEVRCFSYRRDGVCGRMAAFIWREPISGSGT